MGRAASSKISVAKQLLCAWFHCAQLILVLISEVFPSFFFTSLWFWQFRSQDKYNSGWSLIWGFSCRFYGFFKQLIISRTKGHILTGVFQYFHRHLFFEEPLHECLSENIGILCYECNYKITRNFSRTQVKVFISKNKMSVKRTERAQSRYVLLLEKQWIQAGQEWRVNFRALKGDGGLTPSLSRHFLRCTL